MRTTIQISDELRKRLKVLASYRDVPYEEILDDLVTVFESYIPFHTEADFASWFEKNLDKFGFKKIIKKSERFFPDYILEDSKGKKVSVELEIVPLDFIRHKHDPKKVDFVVCLYSDRESVSGVPVISVIKPPENPREIIKGDYSSVSIPLPLFKKASKFIKKTGFTSVSDFVEFILRDIISGKESGMPLTKKDIERVKEKLHTLGYL